MGKLFNRQYVSEHIYVSRSQALTVVPASGPLQTNSSRSMLYHQIYLVSATREDSKLNTKDGT
jgi:hypothetical protein